MKKSKDMKSAIQKGAGVMGQEHLVNQYYGYASVMEASSISIGSKAVSQLYLGGEVLTRRRTRQLKEFTIKGQTIMAYSRKDAITRLKH